MKGFKKQIRHILFQGGLVGTIKVLFMCLTNFRHVSLLGALFAIDYGEERGGMGGGEVVESSWSSSVVKFVPTRSSGDVVSGHTPVMVFARFD